MYVNPKQYHRILIRRQEKARRAERLARQRANGGSSRGGRGRGGRQILHLSRHLHAQRRKRGKNGTTTFIKTWEFLINPL